MTSDLLPTGVLTVLHLTSEMAKVLTTSNAIDKISFTGSLSVGAAIQRQCAGNSMSGAGVKPVTLELGGKSPLIVDRVRGIWFTRAVNDVADAMIGAVAFQDT